MKRNVYSLPLYVYTRPFHAWKLSHDSRQIQQIQRYDYLVPRSLVDERSGYEVDATTAGMARAIQNPYHTVVERQLDLQKSRTLLSATIFSYPHLLLTKPKARTGQIRFMHVIACQKCNR